MGILFTSLDAPETDAEARLKGRLAPAGRREQAEA
jgi:hypothetical protein